MIKVAVLGSTGYAGAELVRLLSQHEQVEIAFLDSKSHEGEDFSSLYSNLYNQIDQKCTNIDLDNPQVGDIDLFMCALPHGLTQETVKKIRERGRKVIDLSADFRLKDQKTYEKWYNTKHVAKDELEEAVYGLPEIRRDEIRKASLIANPGCFPTSVILALYPLLKEKMVEKDNIIIDSKSGVSGAGRSLNDQNLFCQVDENIKAYKLASHRHTPEIEQELSLIAGEDILVQFTPHLVPMNRGILSTIYVKARGKASYEEVRDIYEGYYGDEYFIRICPQGKYPETKHVSGSNFCEIGFTYDERTGNLILVSAIDNLVKGASGQAVQNMNLMFGFDENEGLKQMPIWP